MKFKFPVDKFRGDGLHKLEASDQILIIDSVHLYS